MKLLMLFVLLASVTVSSRAAQPQVPYEDLAKAPLIRENQRWIRQRVSSVLPPASIGRIYLLKAETSAMASLDVSNLITILTDAGSFEAPPREMPVENTIWEAFITTKDGHFYQLRAGNDWAILVGPASSGYFRVPQPRDVKR